MTGRKSPTTRCSGHGTGKVCAPAYLGRDSEVSSLWRAMLVGFIVLLCPAGNAVSQNGVREITVSEAVGAISQCRGSVVMFHLYASWCAPCVRELPEINRIGFQYGGKGFVLLAFSVDQNSAQLTQFLGDNQLSFVPARILPWEKGELARAIRSTGGTYRDGIPYTAIYDRSGRLAQEWTGGNSYETYSRSIEPLLAPENPAPASGVDATRLTAPAGLNFELAEHRAFKVAQKRSNFYVLTRNGQMSTTATAEPYFLAGSAHRQSVETDRAKFAEERLRSTGAISNVSIKESKKVQIDNISGFEFIAEAKDTDLNKPVVIYQAMLFTDNRYYLMQGFTPPQEKDRNIRAFREIAGSFRRH